jgi:alpha-1,2-mannosyltransferase
MRADPSGRARMSTIDPALRVDATSPFRVPDSWRRSPLAYYLLRSSEALALVIFLSFCVMWVRWQLSTPGVSKISGDFVSFWSAGTLALAGRAADAYHLAPHFLLQIQMHGDPAWGYLAFFYPPFFLLLCAGLAVLPYFPALCVWLAATSALYAAALRALLMKSLRDSTHAWVLFLGYPAVMVNAGFGQNGFLSTALLCGAALWLDRRPALAGFCLGCLAYKPQLGLIVPLALAIAGRWRCFAAAAATVLALVAAATLAFGPGIWSAFFADMTEARRNWMEPVNPLSLVQWITVFSAVRLHGGPLPLAYAAQAAVSITAAALLVRALLLRAPGERSGAAEIAAVVACVPFCSPFMLQYDLVILAMPMAWLLGEALRNGFRRGEGLALAGAFAAPVLFKITAFDNAIKLSVIATSALLFAVVLRRMTEKPARISGLDRALPTA